MTLFPFLLVMFSLSSTNPGIPVPCADTSDRNNNFYDNEETHSLKICDLWVEGEVENPGKVDLSLLKKRSVIVKETLLNETGFDSFVGAYRYDGYSLFDILQDRIVKKKNSAEFRPVIDLYVEIENANGEKVVVSWGEIFYPNFLHNIIVATDVMRIVHSRTKDLWPLPSESRLVVATDLVSERNISSPSKITVRSCPQSFPVNREINPLFSDSVCFYVDHKHIFTLKDPPPGLQTETLHTIFYGKGRGIHSTQPFSGIYLKELLKKEIPPGRGYLRTGLLVIAGKDGYRSVFSYSEIMNRNDQAEILLVPCPEEKDGGRFRIFPSCDFFSDRAVKAVSGIYFSK